MTVGNKLLGRFDRDEALPLREAPPAVRKWSRKYRDKATAGAVGEPVAPGTKAEELPASPSTEAVAPPVVDSGLIAAIARIESEISSLSNASRSNIVLERVLNFERMNTHEVALTKGEGRSIWLLGDLYTFKVTGEALSVTELTAYTSGYLEPGSRRARISRGKHDYGSPSRSALGEVW